MPIAGSLVLDQLQAALKEMQAREAGLRTEWRKASDQMAQVVAQRGDTIEELARHYLPDLSQESIAKTLAGIRKDLGTLWEQKEQRIKELVAQLKSAQKERDETDKELQTVTAQLNEKVQQREHLEQVVSKALKENEEFQTLSTQALRAETELQRNEERIAEITREAAEKLPAYEDSRLFRYLHRRNFGTEDYHFRGLTRRLDRWVAQLIDYYPSRKSYEFLKRTPQLMREEFERRQTEFDALMEQVEELERFASEEAGLTLVLKEGEQIGTIRDALVSRLDGRKAQCQKLEQELFKIQQSQDAYYEKALERLRRFLSETKPADLEHHAQSTPETTDDQLVQGVVLLTKEMDEIMPHVNSLSRQCEDMERQSSGLDWIVRRYQQSNFDAERSYFPENFDLSLFLDRFLKGTMTKDDLWQSVRRSQNFTPTWTEESASQLGKAIQSPLGSLLLHAMIEVAGAALSNAAQRSIDRRSSSGHHRPSRSSAAPSPPRASAPPARRNRGFTSGDGF